MHSNCVMRKSAEMSSLVSFLFRESFCSVQCRWSRSPWAIMFSQAGVRGLAGAWPFPPWFWSLATWATCSSHSKAHTRRWVLTQKFFWEVCLAFSKQITFHWVLSAYIIYILMHNCSRQWWGMLLHCFALFFFLQSLPLCQCHMTVAYKLPRL